MNEIVVAGAGVFGTSVAERLAWNKNNHVVLHTIELDVMEDIIPWDEWVEFVRPYYPSGKRGRPTKGIEKMLRMYLLQVWFNLSDEGIEDAIYDSYAFRKFMGINFNEEQVPDATTLLKFRHLLEKNQIIPCN